MKDAWLVVTRLRPTMLVAALAVLMLSQPSQMLELYLIDMEMARSALIGMGDAGAVARLAGFLIETRPMLVAMTVGALTIAVLWLSSVHLVCLDVIGGEATAIRTVIAKSLVVLIAIAPILGVTAGIASIRANEQLMLASWIKDDATTYLLISAAFAAVAGLVIGYATFTRLESLAALAARMFAPTGVMAGVALIVALTIAVTAWPTALPWATGTQALVYLFLAAVAFTLTWFSHVFRRTGWPVTVIVVAAGLCFAWLGLNDNHWVETQVSDVESPGIERGFEEWFAERKDREHFARLGKPYPVYIVAAEGGGMYAGYHVASFLGRMQDACPNFAQHTFAISSVSGGSLGAGVFATLANRFATNRAWERCKEPGQDGYFAYAAREYFQADLLSPLVGAALFPDLLQRLLPVPFKALDRAKALETAFGAAWWGQSEYLRSAPVQLEQDFYNPIQALWSPSGAAPALFLNASDVTTGSRFTLSSLGFADTPTTVYYKNSLCPYVPATFELSLVSAISLSARFPWLTPAGWIELPEAWRTKCQEGVADWITERYRGHNRLYLVDGGYFENSGLESAVELAARLRNIVRTKPAAFPGGVDIKIVMVMALDESFTRYSAAPLSRAGFGEALTPIMTLLSTRVARTRAAHLRETRYDAAYNRLDLSDAEDTGYYAIPGASIDGSVDGVHHVVLDARAFFLPLGWRLSQGTIATIDQLQPNTILTQKLIMRELAGEDTDELKGRKKR